MINSSKVILIQKHYCVLFFSLNKLSQINLSRDLLNLTKFIQNSFWKRKNNSFSLLFWHEGPAAFVAQPCARPNWRSGAHRVCSARQTKRPSPAAHRRLPRAQAAPWAWACFLRSRLGHFRPERHWPSISRPWDPTVVRPSRGNKTPPQPASSEP